MKNIGDYTIREVKEICDKQGQDCKDCIFRRPDNEARCRFDGSPMDYDVDTPVKQRFNPSKTAIFLLAEIPNASWLARDSGTSLVDIYETQPNADCVFESGERYFDGLDVIASVPANIFPGIESGDCVSIEDYLA